MPIDSQGLAERLRDLREKQGLSMSEIARRARISKAYLSQLEHGESTQPSYDVLTRLAVALGTSPDYLAGSSSGQTTESSALPAALRAFADQTSLPEADVSMLAHIHYRGKVPRNADDWAHIYETIKRTIR